MGKSFNNDIDFGTDIENASINGLTISTEAIDENKHKSEKAVKDILKEIDINKTKKESKKEVRINQEQLAEQLLQENKRISASVKEYDTMLDMTKDLKSNKSLEYVKKTMIFKQEYLDIIDGLADINNMQIKDVLNQLLEKAINQIDESTREKALKRGKKEKPVKINKSLF